MPPFRFPAVSSLKTIPGDSQERQQRLISRPNEHRRLYNRKGVQIGQQSRRLSPKYRYINSDPGLIVKLGRVEYRVVEIGGLPRKNSEKKDFFLGEFNGIHEAT
jgi:hypothetical protein